MPNPDLRAYVDLTVYDKTPQDLVTNALLQLSTTMPEWTPREGNTEMLLIEGIAFEVAEAIYAINRLPAATVEVLLQFLGIFRDIGQQPIVNLEFDVIDTNGYTIPAGTSALLSIVDGIDPVVFSTDVDLVIAPGSNSGIVSATGDRFTQDANSIVLGTELSIVDSLQFVNGIKLNAITTTGRDQEDDASWIARGTQRFSELSEALTLARQFQAAALEDTSVSRALAIDNYNPTSGHSPGADPGYVTVAVYGDNAAVSSTEMTNLQNTLATRAQANLGVRVVAATIETLNITCAVVADVGADSTFVQSSVQAALNNYLGYLNWNWSQTVRVNALLAVIGNAQGVAYVSSITSPSADVTYTDVAPLVELGTLSVTVS